MRTPLGLNVSVIYLGDYPAVPGKRLPCVWLDPVEIEFTVMSFWLGITFEA